MKTSEEHFIQLRYITCAFYLILKIPDESFKFIKSDIMSTGRHSDLIILVKTFCLCVDIGKPVAYLARENRSDQLINLNVCNSGIGVEKSLN